MSFPAAAGIPAYSGNFIPEIWSTKVIEKYYDGTVLSQISNTDYEGEIKSQGDKVIIRTIPTLEINDYQVGQTLVNQRPVGTRMELLIDKGMYWSAIVDDVIEKQQDINAVLDMLDNLRDAVKKGEAIGVIACALGPDDSTTMYAMAKHTTAFAAVAAVDMPMLFVIGRHSCRSAASRR